MESSSAPPTKNDAEQRRSAVEVGTNIKKLLDARRMFEPGHETFAGLQDHVWKKIRAYLENFGDLCMELSATTVTIEEKDVITASREDESISYALFSGGVHEILLAPSLKRTEFFTFLEIWASAAVKRTDPEKENIESLMTQFWEADFQAIELVAISTTSEGGVDEEELARQQELRRVMKSVTGGIADFKANGEVKQSAESFWQMREDDPNKPTPGERLNVDDPTAVQLLATELNMTLTPDDVVAPMAPAVPPPTAEEQDAMRAAIERGWTEGVAARFLLSLFTVAPEANEGELESMVTAIARVLEAMVGANRFDEIHETLEDAKAIIAASRDPNRGFMVYGRLLEALTAPSVVDPAIAALDHPEEAPGAAKILMLLGSESLDTLLGGLDRLRTAEAIERLLEIIGSKRPPPGALARVARDARPDVAKAILQFSAARGLEAEEVRRAVLNHPDRAIRRRMIETLTPADVPNVARQLHPLFVDGDRIIRERALLLCLQAADRSAVPRLSAVLDERKLPAPDLVKFATALGKLGGVEAGIVLRKAFTSGKDTDVRAACALALADMGDRASKPLLEKEAGRFLNRGGLKAACLEALRRLEARTTYAPMAKEK